MQENIVLIWPETTRITLIEVFIFFFMLISLFLDGIFSVNPSTNSYKLWAQNFHDTFSKQYSNEILKNKWSPYLVLIRNKNPLSILWIIM